MAKLPKTAVESIDQAIADSRCLTKIYELVEKNVYARRYGWCPSFENVVAYLRWLRRGFVYAERRLGQEAMPRNFKLSPQPPPIPGWGPTFTAYVVQWDTVMMGIARLAKDSSVESWGQLVPHEGLDQLIPAWLSPMLIAIEESFHRYQLKALKRSVPTDNLAGLASGHPLESEAKQFIEGVARDLLARKPAQAP